MSLEKPTIENLITMKTKKLFMLMTAVLTLAACSDDEGDIVIGKNTKPKETTVNINRNTDGPNEAKYRLEFPHLKGGNNVVIVHRAVMNNSLGDVGVNYCVEWDPSMTAQRWSCYQLYSSINYNTKYNVKRYYADNDGSLSASCQYPNDPDLSPTYQMTADPYKYNNFDHGHICPSADRLRSSESNYQTFFITNMQPQYTNFNGYQPTGDQNAQPQPVPQQGQPMPPQGQPTQQIPYQAQPVVQQKDNSTTMGVLSIVFSFVSLFLCPYIFGAVGIVCGITGLTKKKGSVVCWIGLILGIISLIINIIWTVYQAAHPEIQQQTIDNLKNLLESSIILFR